MSSDLEAALPMNRPNKGRTGAMRAFRCLILLALHRTPPNAEGRREICDLAGAAGLKLLSDMGIVLVGTPSVLSRTLYAMKGRQLIDTSAGAGTYAIWLLGELTDGTIRMLEKEEPWARAFVRGQHPLTRPDTQPRIEFKPLKQPERRLAFPASEAGLIAHILGLEAVIRQLTADNATLRGLPHEADSLPGVSPEVLAFMSSSSRLFRRV